MYRNVSIAVLRQLSGSVRRPNRRLTAGKLQISGTREDPVMAIFCNLTDHGQISGKVISV
jgi:hypothetical protein